MSLLQRLILTLAAGTFTLLSFSPATVSAGPFDGAKGQACKGANLSDDPSCADSDLSGTIKTIVNILSAIVGIAAVIMVIIGGFRYITSAGDTAGVSAAKNTVIYALIGLIIAALAQVIVRFVLGRF